MLIFKDLTLNYNVNLRCELSKIYGIGIVRANYVVDLFGIGKSFFTKYLNYYLFDGISAILKIFFKIDDRLKLLISQRMASYFAMKLIKGIRFSKGLPTKGQRTHSNAHQTKYLKRNQI